LRYPVDNKKITSPYGMRTLPGRKPVFHYGVDFTGKNKSAVAPCDVIIDKVLPVDSGFPCRFKLVKGVFDLDSNVPVGRAWTPYVICHSKDNPDITFIFKHISPVVTVGEIVEEGETVGSIGNYGFSMGEHLHFEVMIKANHTDPAKWLIKNVNKV